jgi:hypothetical protein
MPAQGHELQSRSVGRWLFNSSRASRFALSLSKTLIFTSQLGRAFGNSTWTSPQLEVVSPQIRLQGLTKLSYRLTQLKGVHKRQFKEGVQTSPNSTSAISKPLHSLDDCLIRCFFCGSHRINRCGLIFNKPKMGEFLPPPLSDVGSIPWPLGLTWLGSI